MRNRMLLGLAAIAVVVVIGIATFYFQLTAPVQVASTPPVAPTLGVAANLAVTATSEPARTAESTEQAGGATPAQNPTATNQTAPSQATGSARVYRIDATQSEASYSVDETFFEGNRLVTAVGTTNAVAGDIFVNPSNMAASQVGEIVVDISQLQSDSSSRDNAIRNRWLESARYPLATFKNAVMSGAPSAVSEGEPFSFDMTGDMTVRESTQKVTWEVEATLQGDVLSGEAVTQLKMSQFGFEAPRLTALIVEDDVTLKLRFVANAVDGVGGGSGEGLAEATATPATSSSGSAGQAGNSCVPTREEGEGPAYVPNAPERSVIGEGHMLYGVVRSSEGCGPLPGAKVELWMANAGGTYDDANRATIFANASGAYRLQSNVPVPYGGGEAHVHIRVTVEGHRTLTTLYIPEVGSAEGLFDVVLVPEGQ